MSCSIIVTEKLLGDQTTQTPQSQTPSKTTKVPCTAAARAVGLVQAAHGLEVTGAAFTGAGANFFLAGAAFVGGCFEPTPFEPVTCVGGSIGAVAAGAAGITLGGIGVFEIAHDVIPGVKQALTCGL